MPRSFQTLTALDMEGVLTPEVWVAVAEHTGIDALSRTTRDEPDYERLMKARMEVLNTHKVTMSEILDVVNSLVPLEGAREFLDELRRHTQVVLLSDTFDQFGRPLMRRLGWPVLLCHTLIVEHNRIVGYRLRMSDQKMHAIRAFQSLNYRVVAVGDSYNDVSMLEAADAGILFRAPANITAGRPGCPRCSTYEELMALLTDALRLG